MIHPEQLKWRGLIGRFRFKTVTAAEKEIIPPEKAHKIIGAAGFPIWVTETQDEVRFWSDDFELYLDLILGEGELRHTGSQGFLNALRVLSFYGTLSEQGIMLHAAGVVKEGKSYIFPGASGAGKTTIVRHSPSLPILSDEIVAVQMNGTEGSFIAHGTPFYSDWGQPGEEIAAPVKALIFPVHGAENFLIPLSPGQILARLLPCVYVYTRKGPILKKIFALTARLAETVPGYALHFRPGPDFWQAIDGF